MACSWYLFGYYHSQTFGEICIVSQWDDDQLNFFKLISHFVEIMNEEYEVNTGMSLLRVKVS